MNSPFTKTLWMGDIDCFIDEEFIFNIFRNLSISQLLSDNRYKSQIRQNNTGQTNRSEAR